MIYCRHRAIVHIHILRREAEKEKTMKKVALVAIIGLLALPVFGQSPEGGWGGVSSVDASARKMNAAADEAMARLSQGLEATSKKAEAASRAAGRNAAAINGLRARVGKVENAARQANARTGRLESKVDKVAKDVTGALSQTKQLATDLATVTASAKKANVAAADANAFAESVAENVTNVSNTLNGHVGAVQTYGIILVIVFVLAMVSLWLILGAKVNRAIEATKEKVKGDIERSFPLPLRHKVEATDPQGESYKEERLFRGTEDQLQRWFEVRGYTDVTIS